MNAVLEHKRRTLGEFTRRLLASPVGDQIARIILYGSVARGDATQESDVDVLVLSAGPVREVDRVAGETASELWLEQGDRVEPMVYSSHDDASVYHPFLYRVLRDGQEVFHMADDELKRKDIETLYELAEKYLSTAKFLAESEEDGRLRLAIDGGYNAVELCIKAFLRDTMETLPKTHGGVLQMFSDRYVKTGKVAATLAHDLRLALQMRHSARYDGNALITNDTARHVLRMAGQMSKALADHLAKTSPSVEEGENGDDH